MCHHSYKNLLNTELQTLCLIFTFTARIRVNILQWSLQGELDQNAVSACIHSI